MEGSVGGFMQAGRMGLMGAMAFHDVNAGRAGLAGLPRLGQVYASLGMRVKRRRLL